MNKEECDPGIGGVAVPIRSDSGEFLGAVTLVPMIDELTPGNIEGWLPQLRVVAETLSSVLMTEARSQLVRDENVAPPPSRGAYAGRTV